MSGEGELHDKKAGCSEVLSEVWAFLDNECDGKQREILRQHLDECSPCLEQYGIEEHLKILLARKCGGDHASAEFKERLRACIKEKVLERTVTVRAEVEIEQR
ncbi:mycothiol system anti-sigma-R factor [Kutzneria buriramensis]|uniref:Mycothiol system anti-sigma-R factor n=1 Tax=Kutzneria buriramensis TaxID=1045776 RepID=A0A3E0IAY8_9PSEU|nr:mycothiol system anti-sigma-R factor [Kutzneria buriramensis]REH55847.1 mycothiol system anti-sigma-R factor [Kutzneria buriramensis]